METEKIGLLVSLCVLSETDLVPRVNTARFSLFFKLYLNFRQLLSHYVMRLLCRDPTTELFDHVCVHSLLQWEVLFFFMF